MKGLKVISSLLILFGVFEFFCLLVQAEVFFSSYIHPLSAIYGLGFLYATRGHQKTLAKEELDYVLEMFLLAVLLLAAGLLLGQPEKVMCLIIGMSSILLIKKVEMVKPVTRANFIYYD